MKTWLPSPQELVHMLALQVPFLQVKLAISDRDPDPGLFGPGSVTWRILREPLMILGGGRALLMQAAHPHVAQGAIDHSTYASDPFGRLVRTTDWVAIVSFGTTSEARRACQVVNALHARVRGDLPRANATRRVRGNSSYTAADPELLLWVLATFVDTMLVTHDALVGDLASKDRDGFVQEWGVVGELMGVPRTLLWRDRAGLSRYVKRQLEDGPILPGEGSRLVARTILHPPLPNSVLTPFWDLVMFPSVALLPAKLRAAYGLGWTPLQSAAWASFTAGVRASSRIRPEALRSGPVYQFAQARVRGQLAEAAA